MPRPADFGTSLTINDPDPSPVQPQGPGTPGPPDADGVPGEPPRAAPGGSEAGADSGPGAAGFMLLPRAERLAALLAKARVLPRVAGVYLMKDAEGRVIYVGKAGALPNRVASYFIPSADLGPRKQPMLDLIHDFETIPCEGEWEALLMESRLIKDLHPHFNDRLTDGRSFPYLVVTTRDEFPGVFITREPAAAHFRGARVFGPFTGGGSLRHAVQVLQRVFRFRTCELTIEGSNPANASFRPCLLHDIHQCTAPCANRISRASYRADIDRFLRFLTSKRSAMLKELRAEMETASAALEFERAAALRDQLRAIERLDDRETRGDEGEYDWQPEVTMFSGDPLAMTRSLARTLGVDAIRCIEGFDIAHLGGSETVGSKVCFVDGRPFKEAYRRFRVRTAGNDDFRALQEVVSRRYRDAGKGAELFPDVVLIDGGIGQLHAALAAFDGMDRKPPLVISLAKREELIHAPGRSEPIRLGRENPGLRLCQAIRDEAHRYAQHYHHILQTKRLLPPRAPRRGKERSE